MSVVNLTDIPIAEATWAPVTFSRIQRPDVGAAFRVDRLGNRNAFMFATPPMPIEPTGRRLGVKLADAERQGGLFSVPQVEFDVGAPGFDCVVASDTASGRIVPLAGVTPYYAIRAGQWLSIIVDGQRYLDRVMEQVIVASDGTASVRIQNLIRVPLTADDVVELAEPKIEGTVEMQSPAAWSVNRMTQFSFTVTEDR